jgi:hypothetical protein
MAPGSSPGTPPLLMTSRTVPWLRSGHPDTRLSISDPMRPSTFFQWRTKPKTSLKGKQLPSSGREAQPTFVRRRRTSQSQRPSYVGRLRAPCVMRFKRRRTGTRQTGPRLRGCNLCASTHSLAAAHLSHPIGALANRTRGLVFHRPGPGLLDCRQRFLPC